METYIAGFLLMLIVALMMSVGLILAGKRLPGSCGGSKCQACSKRVHCIKKSAEEDNEHL